MAEATQPIEEGRQDEAADESADDGATSPRVKRRRYEVIFYGHKLEVMLKAFNETQYPGPGLIDDLAEKLDLKPSQIKNWFTSRRARIKHARKRKRSNSLACEEDPLGPSPSPPPQPSPTPPSPPKISMPAMRTAAPPQPRQHMFRAISPRPPPPPPVIPTPKVTVSPKSSDPVRNVRMQLPYPLGSDAHCATVLAYAYDWTHSPPPRLKQLLSLALGMEYAAIDDFMFRRRELDKAKTQKKGRDKGTVIA